MLKILQLRMHEISKYRSHRVPGLNAWHNELISFFSNLSKSKWADDCAFQYGLLVCEIKII